MTTPRPLPAGPLIAFYGDDFTGASAAMEATAFAGIPTVLFLSPPDPERLRAFADARVIGIAGVARAQSPEWMDIHLPPVFEMLTATGAPVIHYKVCSTFDSAPHVGSIGRVVDIAAKRFGGWMPLIVADPHMGRYQAFGNLFAKLGDAVHRLDRHPVMSRHPITPMDEADLQRHLACQTGEKIGLVDCVAMKRGDADAQLADRIAGGCRVMSIDVLDRETLIEAGRLVWERGERVGFTLGSQGVEAALAAYWRSTGLIEHEHAPFRAGPVDRIACVSGSLSAVTAGQIAFARDNGFATVALDTARAVDPKEWIRETGRATEKALGELSNGRDVIVCSAVGGDDPIVAALNIAVASSGVSSDAVNDRIGVGLGSILDSILATTGLTRSIVAGGDTSGRAASMLGIDALTAIAPLAPGAPLCRAHATRADRDGLEIALKGGQVGGPDFFVAAKRGNP